MPSLLNEFSNLRSDGEEVEYSEETIKEYVRCSKDIIYFAEKYVYITHNDKGLKLVKLVDHQKRLLKAFVETPDGKKHNVVLSARQSYKTTTTFIYVLWYALFNSDKEIAIMANKEKSAKGIIKRIKTAYKKLPKWLQKGITPGGWNQRSISFDNNTTISASTTSPTSARSEAISLLILDEFAFVPSGIADEFMASVYPTIVSGETSKIIILSTVNGQNHFWDIYTKAVRGENNFFACRVYWNEVPGRDEKWKQSIIRDIGILRWMQEFECSPIGSSSTLIDSAVLTKLTSSEPVEVLYDGLMFIYEKLDKNSVYLVAADAGAGIGSDYSVIQVIKIISKESMIEIAVYRNNKISPQDFALVVDKVSKMYNNAYIMAENNGKEGGRLVDNLWNILQCDRLINPDKKDVGVLSTSKSKFNANMNLKNCIEKGHLKVVDRQTIVELTKYIETNAVTHTYACEDDKDHDDCVISLMWSVYFLEILDLIPLTFNQDSTVVNNNIVKYSDKKEDFRGAAMVFSDTVDEEDIYIDDDGTLWQ
jgi:hypothetical protein